MGIRPYSSGQVPVRAQQDSVQSRYGAWQAGLNDTGSKFGEGLADVDAKAASANSGAGELAIDLTALESQPLLLWWDGTGTKPQLKPGWGLFNTATGKVEKG